MGRAIIGRPKVARASSFHEEPEVADPSRLKVVFLSPGFFHGGAERWILSLCRWLKHDVLGVVVEDPSQIDPSMRRDLRQMAPLLPSSPRYEPEIKAVTNSADVVIAWGISDVSRHLRGSTAPVVWVNHCSGPMATPLIKACRNRVNHWVGVAEICRTSFPADLAPRMTVIHNGADIERTTPILGRAATRAKWGLRDDQIAIGYVGRLSPEKRPEAVAEAVACLPSNYVAVLVGGGRDEVNTRAKCERIAPGRCLFAGHQPRSVGDSLAAIDVWLNASPSEGFCLSLLEAQLARVPCVSTKTGIWPEMARAHGELAQSVEIGCDGQSLADAVLRALSSESMEIIERAYGVAREHFTAPAMGARWDQFLEDVSGCPRPDCHSQVELATKRR